MRTLSLKIKFILIGISIVVAMLLILTINLFSNKTIVELETSAILTQKLNTGMLTLRRNEKDFLARNNLKYQKKFSKNYNALQENVILLEKNLPRSISALEKYNS